MSRIVEYLKEVNLDNEEYLNKYIWNSTTEELIIIIEHFKKLIEQDYIIKTYNPFTFLPNNELSGTGGCSELSCKIKRATRFAIFSSLYAEDVYIQLNFITNPHYEFDIEEINSDYESYFYFRYDLQCDIAILNTYSKLIESGIVHIAPPKNLYCKNCFQKQLLGSENFIDIEPIKKSILTKVKLYIDSYDKYNNFATFKVENIDEFFPEHGQIFTIPPKDIIKLPKSIRKAGSLITDKNLINDFVDNFVEEEFVSSCYYASYCRNNNAKFITNKISDGMFMELTNQKNRPNHGLDYYNAMPKYDMPFVADITIEKALHLREVEGESFNKYRVALNKSISQQCKTNSPVELRDIYDDILFPAFYELDEKLKNIRNGFFKKTFYEITLLGTVISAGLYTGLIPNNMTDIMKSLGIGTSASITVGRQIFSKAPWKETLRENDYYFLWQLKRSIDKNL
ncbi:hypothetical protein SAMN02745196_02312 [Clostridium collagenovorans DSM 3089]|uniref:Uncharacterized protein n=1 Tax=Clostridium collagenovorans DSM 3089 TaxID=1121306 RepID=A0A1M5XMW6_9CLOT|nr:hypothetical protein [Clostridium collagenovorans]SHI00898.1 hypothetical protein SAMN02745196_02312 [Clostridium collagenovorans DSM 3089]